MNDKNLISDDKKLHVQFRLEPGCLGPQGLKHVNSFCLFAQKEFESKNNHFVKWEIIPRLDKSAPEITYKIRSKKLDIQQASKYLKVFNQKLSSFEDSLNDDITLMIDRYLSQ
ncbi:MAG: hypothetical protein COB38_05390 [Gammaproteobacteria bacterium]|nr:MAG: hypothetical protein COB38_05390 [Gammaproteobacteria bacterium]